MEQHQNLSTTTKAATDRREKGRRLNEAEPAENTNKNGLYFPKISHVQKEVPPSYKPKDHAYEQLNTKIKGQ